MKVLKKADKTWHLASEKEKDGKKVWEPGSTEPSKINHSSVPFNSRNSGLTIEYAEQTTTLSLIVLRRLRFPIDGVATASTDVLARTVLAALGLAAATLAFEAGMGLRSRCLLWPDGPMTWDLLKSPGEEPQKYALSCDQAVELLNQAIAAAKARYLPWPEEPIELKPSSNLVELVRRSQLEATKEDADTSGK